MAVDEDELGRRLRNAREQANLSQAQVADAVGISRSAITQMELGNRSVSGVELSRLADLYNKSIDTFLKSTNEDSLLGALFRAHDDYREKPQFRKVVAKSLQYGKELARLKSQLDLEVGVNTTHNLGTPHKRWDSVQQGAFVASEERRRLDLGSAPVPELVEILESQGITVIKRDFDDEVSGFTLLDEDVGPVVVVNGNHSANRRRFSLAHEYGHVLLDRERAGSISGKSQRNDLLEVRANSFAANFLLPDEGARNFFGGGGTHTPGKRTQSYIDSFSIDDDTPPFQARARGEDSPDLSLHDVLRLAEHFNVSPQTALYRLRNSGIIAESKLDELLTKYQKDGSELRREFFDEQSSSGSEEGSDHDHDSKTLYRRYFPLVSRGLTEGFLTVDEGVELLVGIDPDFPEEKIRKHVKDFC